MKLIYEPTQPTAVHRRRIADLMEENASLKRRVSSLQAVIKRYGYLKQENINCRRREKWVTDKYDKMAVKYYAHYDECGGLQIQLCRLQEELLQYQKRPLTKSYFMSTEASRRARRLRSPSTFSEPETVSSYDSNTSQSDDKSSPASSVRNAPLPSYMRSTAASRAKAGETSTGEASIQLETTQDEDDVEEGDVSFEWPPASEPEQDEQPGYPSRSSDSEESDSPDHTSLISDEKWNLMLQGRLGRGFTLTQWVDKSWLSEQAARVKLRSKFVKELQTEALDLGVETWYAWGLAHTPKFMAQYAPSGPWDLLVDRATLICRGVGIYPDGALSGTHFCGHRGLDAQRATRLVFDLLGGGLRNKTCHFDFARTWASDLFHDVYPVLDLAREMGDGTRARRTEALLARVRREAEDTHADIARRLLLAALPGPRRPCWEYHHEALFDAVLSGWRDHASEEMDFGGGFKFAHGPTDRWGRSLRHSQVVVQAAYAWYDGGGRDRAAAAVLPEYLHDVAWNGEKAWDGAHALGYWYDRPSPWHSLQNYRGEAEWWPEINARCRWERTRTPRRRPSVHGADVEGMERADSTGQTTRWKARHDPRRTLNWLDLALKF